MEGQQGLSAHLDQELPSLIPSLIRPGSTSFSYEYNYFGQVYPIYKIVLSFKFSGIYRVYSVISSVLCPSVAGLKGGTNNAAWGITPCKIEEQP